MSYDITHTVDDRDYLVVTGANPETGLGFEIRLDKEMAAALRPLLAGYLRSPAGTVEVLRHGYDGDVTATFEADDWEVTEDGHLEVLANKVPIAMYRSGAWIGVSDTKPDGELLLAEPEKLWLLPDEPSLESPAGPIVHAVMYRDHKMGTLCESAAWGTPELFTAVTEHVTCPACRNKLDPGRS